MMNDRKYDKTKTILLCTFTSKSKQVQVIERIKETFSIDHNRIFVLRDKNIDPNRYILTYNIIVSKDQTQEPHHRRIPNTIKINRNKEYRCLYTLDALNKIIEKYYPNPTDDDYDDRGNIIIDWSKFPNCILVVNKDEELVQIETEVESRQKLSHSYTQEN